MWGTSDVLASRLGLTPQECKREMQKNENHSIAQFDQPDLLRAGWDAEAKDWGAFAAENLQKNDVIGV